MFLSWTLESINVVWTYWYTEIKVIPFCFSSKKEKNLTFISFRSAVLCILYIFYLQNNFRLLVLFAKLREVKYLAWGHRGGEWTGWDPSPASRPGRSPLCFTTSQEKEYEDWVYQILFPGSPAKMFYLCVFISFWC